MDLDADELKRIFQQTKLDAIFPPERADRFFDALFGDATEGAYDIRLAYNGVDGLRLHFDLQLHQRPGKCLACNLTYGLPMVFERHPIIDIQGVVDQIGRLLDGNAGCQDWQLGRAKEVSRQMHVVPLFIDLKTDPDSRMKP